MFRKPTFYAQREQESTSSIKSKSIKTEFYPKATTTAFTLVSHNKTNKQTKNYRYLTEPAGKFKHIPLSMPAYASEKSNETKVIHFKIETFTNLYRDLHFTYLKQEMNIKGKRIPSLTL